MPQQLLSSPGSAHFPADNQNTSLRTPFCCSWNERICHWALGKCSFCHMCSTVMGKKPRSTAPFLTQLDIAQVPPLQAGEGDGLDGLEAPCDDFVYSSVTLPLLQNELSRVAKLLCSVPAPVQPSITDVIFSPLAQVAEVSPLCLQLELCHHPDRSAVAFVISNQLPPTCAPPGTSIGD